MENPTSKFLIFLQVLCENDSVSKEEIKSRLGIGESSFFSYLAAGRKYFSIKYVKTKNKQAFYSIDKKDVAKFFSL
jgi:hypothetical protein